MKKIFIFSILLAIFLFGCSQKQEVTQSEKSPEPLRIVTTIPPLYSLTAHLIEGTDVQLENLLPPNATEHTQNLSPKAALLLEEADLLIMNGLQLEVFLEDSLQDLKATTVDTSSGVELIESDPHIWLSPQNAKIQAKNIYEALITKDPKNKATYDKNFQNLSTKLDDLFASGKSRLEQLELKPYIVFHDAYQYFERDFDIHSTAFLEEFAGQEPSAQYLAEVVDIIKKNDVKVAFSEPQFSPKLLQTLSQDYNLVLGELDPVGQEVSYEGYFILINSNIESFEKLFSTK